jgi:hypothetical protein
MNLEFIQIENKNYHFFLGAFFLGLFVLFFSISSHFKSSSKVLMQNPSNFIGSVPISDLSSKEKNK